jgi:peptidylprolyl isomerase
VKTRLLVVLIAPIFCVALQAQTRAKRARAAGNKPAAVNVEQELKKVEQQWLDAYLRHDPDTMARIEADDFTITYPDGSIRTKAQDVEAQRNAAKQSARPPQTSATEDEHIRVYGNTAVLTGIFVSIGSGQNPNAVFRSRFTDVYVRRGGTWQVVASQLTAIPDSTQKEVTGSASGEVTTPTGLKYVDLVVGTGANPKPGDRVTVHYIGTLESGEKFDSSYDHGRPLTIQIGMGKVIKGWDEGVMTMRVGGKRKLIIPPQLGNGTDGRPPVIPGNSTLIFEVELLSIQ